MAVKQTNSNDGGQFALDWWRVPRAAGLRRLTPREAKRPTATVDPTPGASLGSWLGESQFRDVSRQISRRRSCFQESQRNGQYCDKQSQPVPRPPADKDFCHRSRLDASLANEAFPDPVAR